MNLSILSTFTLHARTRVLAQFPRLASSFLFNVVQCTYESIIQYCLLDQARFLVSVFHRRC